jgi:curli biogenesis system outer membrane secretion channel CsgG
LLRNLILALMLFAPGLALAGPNTLAVLYFQNSGGPAYDALKVGMAQMLINDLVGTEDVTVVERTELQAILDELELGHSGMVDPDTAARVGKLLGAEWMAMGTYFELGGTLYVQSRIVRVETGEILHAFSVNDQATAFMELETELATGYRVYGAGDGAGHWLP